MFWYAIHSDANKECDLHIIRCFPDLQIFMGSTVVGGPPEGSKKKGVGVHFATRKKCSRGGGL